MNENCAGQISGNPNRRCAMETMVSRTLSVHKEHEVLLKLETAGLTDELAQKIVDSKGNDLAAKVVRLIRSGGFEPSTSQDKARAIMGKNYFGVEEAIQYFKVNLSKQWLTTLAKIPWSEEVLRSCKDTHILVAVFPLSILDIRFGASGSKLFYDHSWYKKESFAENHGEAAWHLVRKALVPNSTSKTWDSSWTPSGCRGDRGSGSALSASSSRKPFLALSKFNPYSLTVAMLA